jgi:hypothetical protein
MWVGWLPDLQAAGVLAMPRDRTLDEDVDHITVLVNGAPEIVLPRGFLNQNET